MVTWSSASSRFFASYGDAAAESGPSSTLEPDRDTRQPDVESYDDGGGGLYGLDAEAVLDSTDGGTYRIRLYSNDVVTVLGRLTVTDCDATWKCRATGMPLASTPALTRLTPTGR